jgi:hypothetical protein
VLRLQTVVSKFRTPSRADSENENISRRQVTALSSDLGRSSLPIEPSVGTARPRPSCTARPVNDASGCFALSHCIVELAAHRDAARPIDAFDFSLARYGT